MDKHQWKKTFEEGNIVTIHLRKLSSSYPKLHPKEVDLFQVLESFDENVYKVDLPQDFKINPAFNVADLSKYHPPDTLFGELKLEDKFLLGGRNLM